MARALSHDLHFRHAGAGVGGGDIAPAEAFDKITHGLEQRRALAGMRGADDYRFTATQRQVGQGRFVGHAARKAQHIAQRFIVIGVGPHAATAEGRAEVAVVNGNNRLQAAGLVVAVDHLLVVVEIDMGKHGHGSSLMVLVVWFL